MPMNKVNIHRNIVKYWKKYADDLHNEVIFSQVSYKLVNFLQYIYNWQPIFHPWGQNVGSHLSVQGLTWYISFIG